MRAGASSLWRQQKHVRISKGTWMEARGPAAPQTFPPEAGLAGSGSPACVRRRSGAGRGVAAPEQLPTAVGFQTSAGTNEAGLGAPRAGPGRAFTASTSPKVWPQMPKRGNSFTDRQTRLPVGKTEDKETRVGPYLQEVTFWKREECGRGHSPSSPRNN